MGHAVTLECLEILSSPEILGLLCVFPMVSNLVSRARVGGRNKTRRRQRRKRGWISTVTLFFGEPRYPRLPSLKAQSTLLTVSNTMLK